MFSFTWKKPTLQGDAKLSASPKALDCQTMRIQAPW
jgi:hypothetical protein